MPSIDTVFVSAVSDCSDLMVRSRDRESLEPLAAVAKVEIKKTPKNDYPYRVYVKHEVFGEWVAMMVRNIQYGNFKSEIFGTPEHKYAHSLLEVWSAMHQVEGAAPENKFGFRDLHEYELALLLITK